MYDSDVEDGDKEFVASPSANNDDEDLSDDGVVENPSQNPENKGWDSRRKGGCYPGDILEEDLC